MFTPSTADSRGLCHLSAAHRDFLLCHSSTANNRIVLESKQEEAHRKWDQVWQLWLTFWLHRVQLHDNPFPTWIHSESASSLSELSLPFIASHSVEPSRSPSWQAPPEPGGGFSDCQRCGKQSGCAGISESLQMESRSRWGKRTDTPYQTLWEEGQGAKNNLEMTLQVNLKWVNESVNDTLALVLFRVNFRTTKNADKMIDLLVLHFSSLRRKPTRPQRVYAEKWTKWLTQGGSLFYVPVKPPRGNCISPFCFGGVAVVNSR